MSSEPNRSESIGQSEGIDHVTLEECQLLRLLADDFHYDDRELAEVVGRRPRAIKPHIARSCSHGGRFW